MISRSTITSNSSALPPASVEGEQEEKSDMLWTVQDIAQFAKCSLRHVGNLQRAGLPFVKLGRLTRFDPKAVVQWMGIRQAK